VNCSDHDNFGYDNNVCVHDQLELSVEKLQQDPLESFSYFPVEFLNVEEILGQQLFSGLQIDNDVSGRRNCILYHYNECCPWQR
jgi:hypothetical protein